VKRWLLRPQAEDDLRSIRTYTRRTWGDAQARTYLSAIRAAIKRAAQFPDLGSPHAHSRHSYRTMRVGSHLIVYRDSDDILLVVRILHERMDIDTQLDG
jgi:toxin ParE1/3/4